MLSFDICLSDEERDEIIRAAADVIGETCVRRAALPAARSPKDVIARLAAQVADRSAELSSRLG